ncbi:MAG: hypothetical protein KDC71_21835 [Acidobacteria bacterium]|nr:hypothetical protein [Acidobacteriota bacterium]
MKTPAANIRFFSYLVLSLVLIIALFRIMMWVQTVRAGTMPVTRVEAGAPLTLIYFHRHGCPHCALANPVMAELENRYRETNWLVAEVRPDMDPQAARLYRTYLDEIGEKGILTPLLVVGFNSEKVELFPGFGEALNSREPIENAIRERLGLQPVDLKAEGIRFPVVGLQVLSDLPIPTVNQMLALLSGGLPVSILVFWAMIWAPVRRTFRFACGASFAFVLANIALQLVLFYSGGLRHNWFHSCLRWGLALLLIVWGARLLRHFFLLAGKPLSSDPQKSTQTSKADGLRLLAQFGSLLVAEKLATAWLAEFGYRILASDWSLLTWLGYGSIIPCLASSIGLIYLRFGEFNPRAKRVASLFCGLIILLLGCFLLFALGFRGYGPLWPWEVGA